MEDAKNAFNRLLELKIGEERVPAAYVYNEPGQTLLTSIHESSDSSKSDRSEDGGSDSEKAKPAPVTVVLTPPANTMQKEPEKKNEEVKDAGQQKTTYNPLFTPPRPPRPLSQHYPIAFTPLKKKDFNQTAYIDKLHDYSGCSFDGDAVNEG